MTLKYIYTAESPQLLRLLALIETIYAKNPSDDSVCGHYVRTTERILKAGIVVCFSFIFFDALVFPMLWHFVISGQRYPTFPCLLPGIDINTALGLIVTHTIQTLLLVFGLLTICIVDIFIVIIFANIPMMSTIIVQNIDRLQELLATKRRSLAEIKRQLLHVIWMQREYDR